VVRRKVVRRPKKNVIRKYVKKINKYRKIIGRKTTTPAVKKNLRNKVITIRVIKGGNKYIRRCHKRYQKYKQQAKVKPTPVNQKKVVIAGRRYRKARKIHKSKKVRKTRKRVFKKVVVKKTRKPTSKKPIRRYQNALKKCSAHRQVYKNVYAKMAAAKKAFDRTPKSKRTPAMEAEYKKYAAIIVERQYLESLKAVFATLNAQYKKNPSYRLKYELERAAIIKQTVLNFFKKPSTQKLIKNLKKQLKARGGCKKAKKVLKKIVLRKKIGGGRGTWTPKRKSKFVIRRKRIGGGKGTWTPKRYRRPTKKINFKRKRIGGGRGTWTPKRYRRPTKKISFKRKRIGGGRGTWTPKRYRRPTKKINFKRKRIGGGKGTWTPKRYRRPTKKISFKRKRIGGGKGTWTPKRYRRPTKKISFKRKRIGGGKGTWTPKRYRRPTKKISFKRKVIGGGRGTWTPKNIKPFKHALKKCANHKKVYKNVYAKMAAAKKAFLKKPMNKRSPRLEAEYKKYAAILYEREYLEALAGVVAKLKAQYKKNPSYMLKVELYRARIIKQTVLNYFKKPSV